MILYETLETDIEAAEGVRQEAATWRAENRWKVKADDPDRQAALGSILDQIDDVMVPLRSHIGRLIWEPVQQELETRLREVSTGLQYERRQLKKMRRSV